MSLRIQDAGSLRTITRGKIMVAGVLRELREIKVQDGATLRTVATFASTLSASASPTSASGAQSSGSPISVTTTPATVTPSGGLAPFTYIWARASGVLGPVANSPNSATTSFTSTVDPGVTNVTVFRCTVTDAVGQESTADVTASFQNLGSGGVD